MPIFLTFVIDSWALIVAVISLSWRLPHIPPTQIYSNVVSFVYVSSEYCKTGKFCELCVDLLFFFWLGLVRLFFLFRLPHIPPTQICSNVVSFVYMLVASIVKQESFASRKLQSC